MPKKDPDEQRLEEMRDNLFHNGKIGGLERMRILEEFRAARAQTNASSYARIASVAAIVSALISAASLVISLLLIATCSTSSSGSGE
jgi:hypothetical protein